MSVMLARRPWRSWHRHCWPNIFVLNAQGDKMRWVSSRTISMGSGMLCASPKQRHCVSRQGVLYILTWTAHLPMMYADSPQCAAIKILAGITIGRILFTSRCLVSTFSLYNSQCMREIRVPQVAPHYIVDYETQRFWSECVLGIC